MKDLNLNLLRYAQREQIKREIEQASDSLGKATTEDAAAIRGTRQKLQRQLDAGSPESLTGKEKDTLAALEKKLLKRITTNMPTEESMRKNPVGAVDHATKWEKANKKLIRMWKNIRIQLNPDNSDRDLANIDRYRPSGQTDRMRTDAQIPGLMTFGNVDQDDWDNIFPTPQNTALEQAKRRANAEDVSQYVEHAIDECDEKELDNAAAEAKGQMTPEQHAILVHRLQGAREAKKKKREEQNQLDEALETVADVS